MSDLLIKAEHVSKKFCRSLKRSLWYGMKDVTHSLNPWARSQQMNASGEIRDKVELRPDEFWALQDINFEVRRGECLGLIGHNGAGKSTLLKILNGLIRPDAGRITMRGRVGALIELSAGFNPILTGRENIYNQAALLGFSRKEVSDRFDAIVAFSELEDFLDMPLQNYSSGMRVRLGFAVSAHMDPDILLVDEVLAVGDVSFRLKCFNAIGELLRRAAVVFVSHSMPQITRVSNSVMLLDHGRTSVYGSDLPSAIGAYLALNANNNGQQISGSGDVKVLGFVARSGSDKAELGGELLLRDGRSLEFDLKLELSSTAVEARVQFVVWNAEMVPVLDVVASDLEGFLFRRHDHSTVSMTVRVPEIHLNAGRYMLSIHFNAPDLLCNFCRHDNAMFLEVRNAVSSGAYVLLPASWILKDESQCSKIPDDCSASAPRRDM